MKTSNKILMGVLLAFMLILTGLHLALYAKYKSGDFASSREIPGDLDRHPLPAIKYVSITWLSNCYLISYGEQPAIEISNQFKTRISYKVTGDTLVITGDSVAKKVYYDDEGNPQLVNLILPATTQVQLAHGTLFLAGGFDSAHAPSYSIELTDAHVGIMKRYPENIHVFFNRLNLVANKSSVEWDDHTIINELNVQSVSSRFFNRKATINRMNLDIDSTTTVTVSGKNLKSLTEISKP